MTAAVLVAYNPNDVRPGWGALVLVVVLLLATFLLWRSMNTQLGRIQMPPKGSARTPIPGPTSDSAVEPPAATDVDREDDPPPPAAQPSP
jgi:hypothetical protein